MNLAKELLPQ